jgi:hypothetical protein
MSADDLGGFAPPPFNADNALTQIKRALRDAKLSERGNTFELRGKRVVELQIDAGVIAAKVARKLAITPEWDKSTIKSSTEQRKLVDEVKKRLERWEREE